MGTSTPAEAIGAAVAKVEAGVQARFPDISRYT